MPTYNRIGNRRFGEQSHLLHESVECFLRQTYANCELIILNDCPKQSIHFQHSRVRVVNHPARYPSLGEKLNAMLALAQGDVIARWDDDDIYLPERIQRQVGFLRDFDYTAEGTYWAYGKDQKLELSWGGGFFTAAFTRAAVARLNGYAPLGTGEDQELERRLVANGGSMVRNQSAVEAVCAIYRWSVVRGHVSAYGGGGYKLLGSVPCKPARFQIEPAWHRDYTQLARQACKTTT